MSVTLSQDQPIGIAILALGGQGGGVIASWLVGLAEQHGWVAQSTSVPGVAQRTGATVYYVEMMRAADREPVLSLMPVPGLVDIVVAAEWMEAGRAIQRGFVTPNRTCLIASTHRMYSIAEKSVPGEGAMDPEVVYTAGKASAKRFLHADMARLAEQHGSVISASLFGAIAGSGALPFDKDAFAAAIRSYGVGVKASLAAFGAGFDAVTAASQTVKPSEQAGLRAPALTGGTPAQQAELQAFKAQIVQAFPAGAQDMLTTGLNRVIDFQDTTYGATYLEHMKRMADLDRAHGGADRSFQATREAAKYLAGAMAYADVIRVADLKTRASRFARVRRDVKAADQQIVAMTEFMHPRVQELCSLLPERMGRTALQSRTWSGLIRFLLEGGKRVRTDSLRGFLTLYTLAGLRRFRLGSLRHKTEMEHIAQWLRLVHETLAHDYDLAVEVIRARRLIKGYSDTHVRGLSKYDMVLDGIAKVQGRTDGSQWAKRLIELALRDAEGKELAGALKTIDSFAQASRDKAPLSTDGQQKAHQVPVQPRAADGQRI